MHVICVQITVKFKFISYGI